MVAAPPLILGGDLKMSDQNNGGGGDLSKKLNLRGGKFKGGPKMLGESMNIVGKGVIDPPLTFLDQPPPPLFLEIQDVPTFHRFLKKTKVLNNSCNQFLYISTLKIS